MLENASDDLVETLAVCYERGPVPREHRGLAHVATMCDYLATGRASCLAGEDGAMALLERDLAAGAIASYPAAAPSLQPTLRQAAKSTDGFIATVGASATEAERRQRIAGFCRQAHADASRARQVTDEHEDGLRPDGS